MISVIVPCLDAGRTLDACLSHLLASQGVDFEVVVVDDHSSDQSPAIAGRFPCRVLSLPETLGPSFARNAGARIATGDILVFVDADIYVRSDTLALVARCFERDGSLVGMNGFLDRRASYRGLVSRFVNLSIIFQHMQYPPRNRSCFTSIFAVRADFFREAGGFDGEARTPIVDDVLFRWRLVETDRLIWMNRDLVVFHDKEQSLGQLFIHRFLVGFYFLAHNRKYARVARRRPRDIFLHSRYPLNTFLAACLVLSLCAGKAAFLAMTVAGFVVNNAGFLTFCAREHGVIEAALYLPLLPVEAFGFLTGLGAYGLGRFTAMMAGRGPW